MNWVDKQQPVDARIRTGNLQNYPPKIVNVCKFTTNYGSVFGMNLYTGTTDVPQGVLPVSLAPKKQTFLDTERVLDAGLIMVLTVMTKIRLKLSQKTK